MNRIKNQVKNKFLYSEKKKNFDWLVSHLAEVAVCVYRKIYVDKLYTKYIPIIQILVQML